MEEDQEHIHIYMFVLILCGGLSLCQLCLCAEDGVCVLNLLARYTKLLEALLLPARLGATCGVAAALRTLEAISTTIRRPSHRDADGCAHARWPPRLG